MGIQIEGTGGIEVIATGPTPPPEGMELWYIADNVSGSDGSSIAVFPDSSGNQNAATLPVGVTAPTLKTGSNGINGHNVIRFSGTGAHVCYLSGALSFAGFTGVSVYYVLRTAPDALTGASFPVAVGFTSGNVTPIAFMCGRDPTIGAGQVGWPGGTVYLGPVAGIDNSKVFYGSYRYDQNNWIVDGVTTGTFHDGTFPTNVNMEIDLGSGTYPGEQSNFDIAEVIIYGRNLSDVEDAAVKSYLQFKYGLAAQGTQSLQIGYPETLINRFCRRFVHPAGNDANDGKTWQTAKEHILAAYDDLASESGIGEIYIHDGSYVGGEVAGQGIWLYNEDTNTLPGWRQFRSVRFIGVGGTAAGVGFTPDKARFNRGRQGDDQSWDLTKPHIWCYGMETECTFRNLKPTVYGFTRLGVKPITGGRSSVTRDGLISDMWLDAVEMTSPKDNAGAGNFGPCFDCGWLNYVWFRYCQANGPATFQTPALTNTDNVVASTRTWTFANGAFTSDHVGGWFALEGTTNQGQFFIETVVDATHVITTVESSPHLVDETFNSSETIEITYGPSVLDADDHAGWLFSPTAPDGSGDVGSMGRIFFEQPSTLSCGIKYNIGSGGEIGLIVKDFASEGAPIGHPIVISYLAGTNLSHVSMVSPATFIDIDQVGINDSLPLDYYDVFVNPNLIPLLGTANIQIRNVIATNAPAMYQGSDYFMQSAPTTPLALKLYGFFERGHISGVIDAARVPGFAGTALPTSTGYGGNVTNLVSHDPTSWTAIDGAALTASTEDVFGLANACDIAHGAGVPGPALGFAVNPSAPSGGSETWTAGDIVVFGVWVRALTPGTPPAATPGHLDTPVMQVVPTTGGGSFSGGAAAATLWEGNGEWQWCASYAVYTGSTATTTLTVFGTASEIGFTQRYCYPVVIRLKAAEGYTIEYAAQLAAHMATWNPLLAQGSVGTLRKQAFVASGGLGIDASVTRVAGTGSGQLTVGSILSYEPRFAADGKTIIGWVPIYAATINP